MAKVQSSLRFNKDNYDGIKRLSGESGKDFSAIANELIEEAIKARRCPGIMFGDGITGRRARIEGTGIDVWEVIRDYRGMDNNFEDLKEAYHWLTERQLKAALTYYKIYPEEIDDRIQRNESITRESMAIKAPYLS
jgi:uncharacterized protein (DUF433 family)